MNTVTIAWPFVLDHPAWILLIASLFASLLFALIFKAMTDQQALRRINGEIIARTLELVLYRHDLATQIKALTGILRGIGTSMGKILPGLCATMIPASFILLLLGNIFDARPLKPGESAIFKASLSSGLSVVDQEFVLKGSENIVVETPALRVPGANEINWRFRVKEDSPAPSWLELGVRGKLMRRQVAVGSSRGFQVFADVVRSCVNAMKRVAGSLSRSDTVVKAVAVAYPPRELILAGIHIDWFFAFLLMTFAFTGLFKRLIRQAC